MLINYLVYLLGKFSKGGGIIIALSMKRQAIKDILDFKGSEYIPRMINAVSISLANSDYPIPELMTDPRKFADTFMKTRRKYGFDGLIVGLNTGVLGDIAGHMINDDGNVSMDGEEVVSSVEDLNQLKKYDPDSSASLNHVLEVIKIMREEEPDEPIYIIDSNPAHTSTNLIGTQRAFRMMRKDPDSYIEITKAIIDPMFQAIERVIDAGVDYVWSPNPSISGYCISADAYRDYCHEHISKYNKRIKDTGSKLVIHTCGIYDDRFQYVLDEHGDCWHIADTDMKKVKDLYGDKVALMGNVPSVSYMMNGTVEEVYDRAYSDCMVGGYDGKFILSADCDIPPSSPAENIAAVLRAADDAQKEIHGK